MRVIMLEAICETTEDIEAYKACMKKNCQATILLDEQGYEIIFPRFDFEPEGANIELWHLGCFLRGMAQADAVYLVEECEKSKCQKLAIDAAKAYGLKIMDSVYLR